MYFDGFLFLVVHVFVRTIGSGNYDGPVLFDWILVGFCILCIVDQAL